MEYYPVAYKLSDGNVINVHIYDTCGQERYNAISESYYKKGDGILLVFDITSQKSFDKIKDYYVANIREKCKKNIPIILLGNKTDLDDKRVVSQEEAIDLAVNEEFVYKETSCLKNENVADAFETIIEIWNINNKQIIKNKTDIEDERKVPQEEGIALALSHNYKFKETSALKNENVADAFEALIELWNVDYQKNNSLKTRRSSGDFTKKEKNLPRSNTVVNVKKKSLDSESEDASKTIILKKDGKVKPENNQSRSFCC
jgi:small GTP-binding protein